MRAYIQAQQLDGEVSDNGVALARQGCSFGEGLNLVVWCDVQLLLPPLQFCHVLCKNIKTMQILKEGLYFPNPVNLVVWFNVELLRPSSTTWPATTIGTANFGAESAHP